MLGTAVQQLLRTASDYSDLNYRDHLIIDDELYRPSEVTILQGDASKARKKLGSAPTASFEELVKEMVDGDLEWYSPR